MHLLFMVRYLSIYKINFQIMYVLKESLEVSVLRKRVELKTIYSTTVTSSHHLSHSDDDYYVNVSSGCPHGFLL